MSIIWKGAHFVLTKSWPSSLILVPWFSRLIKETHLSYYQSSSLFSAILVTASRSDCCDASLPRIIHCSDHPNRMVFIFLCQHWYSIVSSSQAGFSILLEPNLVSHILVEPLCKGLCRFYAKPFGSHSPFMQISADFIHNQPYAIFMLILVRTNAQVFGILEMAKQWNLKLS